MKDQIEIPLAGERFTTEDSIEVNSPFDGALIAAVPRCSPADVDRAVRTARSVMTSTRLAPYERAEILDRAAVLLRERIDDFARTIAIEAAKPIKTARVEATRA